MFFKILVSAIGGTRNFFNVKNLFFKFFMEIVPFLRRFSGHCKRGFSVDNDAFNYATKYANEMKTTFFPL